MNKYTQSICLTLLMISQILYAQNGCDCTIFPVKSQECLIYCLGNASKNQLIYNLKVPTDVANQISKIKNRKTLKTLNDFKRNLPPKYSNLIVQYINNNIDDNVGKIKDSGKYQHYDIPLLVLGGTGYQFAMNGPPDSMKGDLSRIINGINLKWWIDGTGELKIDAIIRNKNGDLITTIENNEWQVGKEWVSWDKNYNANALEVLDSKGNVVLQIELSKGVVFIAGIFYLEDEGPNRLIGYMFVPGKYIHEPGISGAINFIHVGEHPQFKLDKIFKYPSRYHKGERNENTISSKVPSNIYLIAPQFSSNK